ncbi:MAG: hypothetical protein GY913_35645 [Proteobacteria bacterium]|nr:hypothetical protein [Pseudomonadota bacterium]
MTWLLACTSPDVLDSDPTDSPVAESPAESPADSTRDSQAEECDTAVPQVSEPSAAELCALTGEPTVLASDSFTRDASWDLGETEVGGHAYVEVNEPGSGYVTLTGDALSIHYFGGGSSVPDQWVDVGRTAVADVVVDARMRTYSEYYAGLFGLSYRLPTQNGHWRSAGYHVLLESGVLTLYAGQAALGSVELGDDHDWHDWRIVANGDAHCVYVDEALVLSARDATWERPGYVGAGAYYSIGYVDDLVVSEHPEPLSALLPGFDLGASGPVETLELEASVGVYEVAVTAESGTVDLPNGAEVDLAADGSSDWRLLQTAHTLRVLQDGVEVSSQAIEGQVGTVSLEGGTLTDIGLRELDADAVYPAGGVDQTGRFPVVLYSVSEAQLSQGGALGGNLVQIYDRGESYADYARAASEEGLPVLGNLGSYYVDDADPQANSVESEVRADIEALAGEAGWWSYPEELRFWRDNEVTELSNLYDWTRDASPKPTFMYQANHYTADALAESVPYLDVVGKGSYVGYAGQPRAWVRHQLESTVEGIELAGRTVGPDWQAGERTPVLIAGLFPENPETAADLHHDVWSGVVSGARGVALFSYAYAYQVDSLDGLDGFVQAVAELESGIGDAVLYGDAVEVSFDILAGATDTVEFTPYGLEPMTYACLNVAGWDHAGVRTVVAVSSCDEPLSASISGLVGVDAHVVSEDRALCVDEGVLLDDFEALEVHIYQTEAP